MAKKMEAQSVAGSAIKVIEAVLHAASSLSVRLDDRTELAIALLRGSVDHGRSLAVLIHISPDEYGASACALHRSQLDAFLRGAFFAHVATDDEVRSFREKDEMPSRPTGANNGAPRKLSPNDLAPLVSSSLGLAQDALTDMVKLTWKALNGMVHGGMVLTKSYSGSKVIGFSVDSEVLCEILDNTVAMAQLCLITLANISNVTTEEKERRLVPAQEELARYQSKMVQRKQVQQGIGEALVPTTKA